MMKRRLLAALIALALMVCALPTASAFISSDDYDAVEYWDGTVDTSWYNSTMSSVTLYTGAQLAGLASIVQSGKDTFVGKTIRLGADIVLNQNLVDEYGDLIPGQYHQWLPIGCYEGGWQPFSGTFDGQGHVIRGVYENHTTAFNDDKNHGLFGYTHSATIMNVTVMDSYIYAYDYVGGIVGNAYASTVQNCASYASVAGPVHVGGVVGSAAMDTKVINCFAAGRVKASRRVGGVVGYVQASATIENCASAALVLVEDTAYDIYGRSGMLNGGVAGMVDPDGLISDCCYLWGTASKGVGSGEDVASQVSLESFNSGWMLDRLNTGGSPGWISDGGWPRPSGGVLNLNYSPFVLPPLEGTCVKNFSLNMAEYSVGQFNDVVEDEWYGCYVRKSIQTACCLGIMNGYTDGTFLPEQSLKLCEAIKMALTVYDIYTYGQAQEYYMGPVWYEEIVASAIEKGLIGQNDFTNYEAAASRGEMAYIFSRALPAQELPSVTDQTPPDVSASTDYYSSIISLYSAGVLTGNDDQGTFAPYDTITRSQAAAIISRMAVTSMR